MSVFLNNVDDYLGPSQACVNPLFTAPSKSSANASTARDTPDNTEVKPTMNEGKPNPGGIVPSKRRIRRRAPPRIQTEQDTVQRNEPIRLLHSTDDGFAASEPAAVDINAPSTKKKVKTTVTLSDCLSCSGCVTSAEAVLMSHHSVDKFQEVASADEGRHIVFTISSAALADLYRHVYLVSGYDQSLGDNMMYDGDEIKQVYPSRHQFLQQIANFLHSEFGVTLVVDGAVTQRISLLESAHEFCYRYRQKQQLLQKSEVMNSDVTSVALSSTQTRYIKKRLESAMTDVDDVMEVTVIDHPPGLSLEGDDDHVQVSNNLQSIQQPLPMLASSCPGFVCLVEKTAAPVVPLLSSAKSPMAVSGTLLKSGMITDKSDMSNQSRFHVAVMPCHDKKLEAGRNDFAWERQTLLKYANKSTDEKIAANVTVNEVDLVLTTGELFEILTSVAEKKAGSYVRQLLESYTVQTDQSSCVLVTDDDHGDAVEQSSAESEMGIHGSGSYADFVFRFAAKQLFDCELSDRNPLPWTNPSNAINTTTEQSSGVIRRRRRRQDTTDLRSVTLYKHQDGSYSCDDSESSTPVLSFATAYGFKNVQLVLQSLSKDGYTAGAVDAKSYDYVEVMACPSGCPNGGGQIGSMGQRETPREIKERVRRTMSLMPMIYPNDAGGNAALSLYASSEDSMDADGNSCGLNSTLKGGGFGKSARRLLHTRFHVVPKLELSTGATAGVAVSDTKW